MKNFILILFFSLNVIAAENVFITLNGQFFYKDKSFVCETSMLFNKIYFVAKVENDQVKQASLNKYKNQSLPNSSISFTEEELKGILLYKDYFGRFWLEELRLSQRLAIWSLENLGDFLCSIPKKIKKLDVPFLTFFFDTESLGLEVIVSRSNEEEFSGILSTDETFEVRLVLEETLTRRIK